MGAIEEGAHQNPEGLDGPRLNIEPSRSSPFVSCLHKGISRPANTGQLFPHIA
jgi:hypothetical protein